MVNLSLLAPGHSTCAGCGSVLAIRQLLEATGKDIIITCATGCIEVTSSQTPFTSWRVPWIHVTFENAVSVATGIKAALKQQGNNHTQVIALGGDGGMVDIGFGALSGALERNDDIIIVCYDNEAYANCLSTSTKIFTKNGLKKITEIKEGDEIYAFDQKTYQPILKKCTRLFNNGKQEIIKLETLHHSIKATANHPFLILKRNGRGKQNYFIWKTLSNIKIGDEIVALKNLNTSASFKFKPIKAVRIGDFKVTHVNDVSLPDSSSPDLMEYLGLYVGDGWLRLKKGEVGFALPRDKLGRKRLLDLHHKIFGTKLKADDTYIYVNSVNLAKFINSLGFGHGAKNKKIPDWVFTLPEEEKEAFVRGLMLSDGYRVGNSLRYISSSYELLEELRLLLQTMGYRVGKIHWRKIKKGKKIVKRILLQNTESGYICFSRRGKWNVTKYPSQYRYQNFLIENKNFEVVKVKSKQLIGIEPTLDLRVEGEHNFIANGIVVHNTGMQRSGATPLYAATATSPAGKKIHGKQEWKKDLPGIAAAHKIPYVATASIAYPQDLRMKIQKAMKVKGARYIHIHTPCPVGWRFDSSETIEIARLAVETGMWQLYEIENGVKRITVEGKKKSVSEYLLKQKRFQHLTEKEIKEIQKRIDESTA